VILVDTALRRRAEAGRPVRVAVVGTGFMGRGVISQIVRSTPGLRLVAAVNRHPDRAEEALREAGVSEWSRRDDCEALRAAARWGIPVVTDDPLAVLAGGGVDVVIEATGDVEHGCRVVTAAIDHGVHVVLLNAEVDGTVGPLLKRRADLAGVVYSGCDGDQPGVQMNLYRFVRGIGLEPLVLGNIKGLQDPYRTPTTQLQFAQRWGQNPAMVTSFADGTKISFEQATVANATGFGIEQRGMRGAEHDGHVDELVHGYDVEAVRRLGGVVDYVVGARPGPGVFALAAEHDSRQRHYLELYKLGTGPLYSFYTPYHLCHFEVPTSAARAALFGDAAIAPAGPPVVDVVTTAKRDLAAGHVLDGLGGYDTYGQVEAADVTLRDRMLPMGLAERCVLRRAVPRDQVLTLDDVQLPAGRMVDGLRREQDALLRAGWPAPSAAGLPYLSSGGSGG
jgi:predicted homoserine dehydrogenase-like protein